MAHTLRIASVILPENTNDGRELLAAHKWLKAALLKAYGGYTIIPVSGAWVGDDGTLYEDESIRYEVAMEPTPYNNAKLAQIATEAGQLAEQEAMFVVLTGGEAVILNTAPQTAAPSHYRPAPELSPAGGFTHA